MLEFLSCTEHANILDTDLPPADLLICKHVLQHLTNEDIIKFLSQTKKFKYCLITNGIDPNGNGNQPIGVGDYRPLDLTKKPFNINGEEVLIYEAGSFIHQVLLLKNFK